MSCCCGHRPYFPPYPTPHRLLPLLWPYFPTHPPPHKAGPTLPPPPYLQLFPSTARLMLLLSPSTLFSPTMHAVATVVLFPMRVLAGTMLSYLLGLSPDRCRAMLLSATWEGDEGEGGQEVEAGGSICPEKKIMGGNGQAGGAWVRVFVWGGGGRRHPPQAPPPLPSPPPPLLPPHLFIDLPIRLQVGHTCTVLPGLHQVHP